MSAKADTTLMLHDAERLGADLTHRFSIQRCDRRGAPTGVLCLFDVPPTGSSEGDLAAAHRVFALVTRAAVLLDRAEALVQAVNYDDSGNAGRGGNGGLLSRETIRKADELRLAVNDAKQALQPSPGDDHA